MPVGPSHLPDRAPAPEEILGLLADGHRRRLIALLDEADHTVDELIASVDAPPRTTLEHLARLEAARVIDHRDGLYKFDANLFAQSVRDAAITRLGALNDKHTQLARRFLYRNRLVAMPSEPSAVKVFLDLIVEDFQVGEIYSEREANTILYGWYGDWALLRRLLVDHGYLQRDHGNYWRTDSVRSTPRDNGNS
jgi:hypothetical protein